MKTVTIGNSVTSIGGRAFWGCSKLIIRCNYSSYAHEYAIKNNISYLFVNIKIGDINGDGKINAVDSNLLKRIILGF